MNARPVLLINDDARWCAAVCRFLEPYGIPVVSAATVEAVSQHLNQIGKPSAVVMDIATRAQHDNALAQLRGTPAMRNVPLGFVKKSAALDALLLMLSSTADGHHRAA